MTYHIEQTILLKDFLKETNISKAMVKRIKNHGDFLVNGKSVTVRYMLQPGDKLDVVFPQETSDIIPVDIPLDIVYEDDHYLVIDKQRDIPCIPTAKYLRYSLANALMYYYQEHNIQATVHFVNRLDKETQGLMLVAKDSQAHHLLSQDIKQVTRIYHCLVEGYLEGQGDIVMPIYKDQDGSRIIDDRGQYAKTSYQVLKHNQDTTYVQCCLQTGRTHQIRVHMAAIGHPLVGDWLYGSSVDQPLYLESVYLAYIDPFTLQKRIFKKGNR